MSTGPRANTQSERRLAVNPDAHTLWRAPSWALAVLLACLGMLGPFSIDTYLPAFTGIGRAIGATPVELQQTLSAYLFGFAIMTLFHGALSDSLGRRPVVLWGLLVFTLASAGCASGAGTARALSALRYPAVPQRFLARLPSRRDRRLRLRWLR